MTEDELALQFARWYADDLRYVVAPRGGGRSRWVLWAGRAWQDDETMIVFEMVRRMCRVMREKLPPDAPHELHRRLGSARTIAAVEKLARSDRRLVVTADELKTPANPSTRATMGRSVSCCTASPDPRRRLATAAAPRRRPSDHHHPPAAPMVGAALTAKD